MPRSAASSSVPGLVTVTHNGGGGLLHRLGRKGGPRHGEGAPSSADRPFVPHLLATPSDHSPPVFLVVSGSTWNPPSSVHVDERAVPNSRRPPERMSSVAARSATRTGWFICGTHTTAPCPRRMRLVCMAQAVRKSSGAEQCEYSSRKWCSTTHTASNPSSSATRACSSAFSNTRRSPSPVNGRGTESSKKSPNCMRVVRCKADDQSRSARAYSSPHRFTGHHAPSACPPPHSAATIAALLTCGARK